MASDPSKSTTSSKYDVNSQIAALLEKYFTSPTSSTRPSAVFTSGPNKGLPVSALPPSVTPFSQRGNVRRTSKVTLESAEARRQREDRAQNKDQMDERRRRKENDRIIREQQAQARREDRARRPQPIPPSDEYGPPLVSRVPTTEDEIRRLETDVQSGNIPQRQPAPARNLGPSALSQALGRIEAQPPVSSIFRNTPGPTAADYARAQEEIDLANTQRAFDIGYARKDRELAMEEIANTQAERRRRDEAFWNRMRELDADAYAKHMAAVRAGRPSSSVMPRYDFFDPLASIGNLLGFGD